eukprot:jgi/Psemu1/293614/fgenesh1_pg.2920_\
MATRCIAMPQCVAEFSTDRSGCNIDRMPLLGSSKNDHESWIYDGDENNNKNDERSIDATISLSQSHSSTSFSSQSTRESLHGTVVANDVIEDCVLPNNEEFPPKTRAPPSSVSVCVSNNEDDGDNKNNKNSATNDNGVWDEIVKDFNPKRGGDFKILRAIGRTATVNAVVSATALLGGPIAGIAGYATGGAITAKRLIGDGIVQKDKKEIAKSLAVFGGATSASLAGQAVSGAAMIGLLGATLPVAGAVAFSVGCVSGIMAGALSEWGVDEMMDDNDDGRSHGKTKQLLWNGNSKHKESVKGREYEDTSLKRDGNENGQEGYSEEARKDKISGREQSTGSEKKNGNQADSIGACYIHPTATAKSAAQVAERNLEENNTRCLPFFSGDCCSRKAGTWREPLCSQDD